MFEEKRQNKFKTNHSKQLFFQAAEADLQDIWATYLRNSKKHLKVFTKFKFVNHKILPFLL